MQGKQVREELVCSIVNIIQARARFPLRKGNKRIDKILTSLGLCSRTETGVSNLLWTHSEKSNQTRATFARIILRYLTELLSRRTFE